MGLRINTNLEAIDAQRNLQLTSMDFQKAIQRLSSGLRINSAADDPAGLAVSQTLTGQINGFDQAQRNIQDSISMVQVADGALNDTATALQRMRELAVQASSDTLTNQDRQNIQAEVGNLVQEIDRISGQTEFNTKKLLDGSAGGAQVNGGGTDIQSVQAQAGVTVASGAGNVYQVAKVQNATYQAVRSTATIGNGGVNGAGGSFFTQTSSITVVGASGSQTFTANSGQSIESWLQQVNNSSIGVTAYIDDGTGASGQAGRVVIRSNAAGVKGVDAGGFTNSTGPTNGQGAVVTVTQASGDFAGTGLAIGLDAATTGSADLTTGGAGSQSFDTTAAQNAAVTVKLGATTFTLAGQGVNSNQFQGYGQIAGLVFTVNNATSIAGNDSFTVSQNAALNLQSSPNSGESIHLALDAVNSLTLGVSGLNLSTQSSANTAISTLDTAINHLSVYRSQVGTFQNRLTDALNNASLEQENLTSARSNIQDANIASETTQFTRDQILLQAGTSVLAQANQSPTGLLALLH